MNVVFVLGIGEGAAAGGSAPTFGAQVAVLSTNSDTATQVYDITTDIPAGSRIVVCGYFTPSTQTLTSVTDTDGNTYTIHQTQNQTIAGIAGTLFIASANASAILSAADGITLNFGTPDFGYRFGRVFYCSNATALDISAKATSTGSTTPGAAASTTAANTTGISMTVDDGATLTSAAWTLIGASDFIDSTFRVHYHRKDMTSAASQDPALVLAASTEWSIVWAAFA